MHKLDDDTLMTPALLLRFEEEGKCEGGDGRFFAYVQRSNGELLSHQIGPDAGPETQLFATDTLTYLNRQLHHDGAWCLVFTHPRPTVPPFAHAEYARFGFLWMDHGGDVQFTEDCERGMVWAMTQMTVHDWAKHCESSWMLWHQAMRVVLDPQPNEMFARAKGEKRPSVH